MGSAPPAALDAEPKPVMASDLCRLLTVAAALMVAGAGTKADDCILTFVDGNKLYQECSRATANRFCDGFVAGVADTITNIAALRGMTPLGPNFFPCLPEGITVAQERDVVLKFITEHPEIRIASGAFLVTSALTYRFPCRK